MLQDGICLKVEFVMLCSKFQYKEKGQLLTSERSEARRRYAWAEAERSEVDVGRPR